MKNIISVCFILLFTFSASAEKWNIFERVPRVNNTVKYGNSLFCSTAEGILKININSGEKEYYTKDNSGLKSNNLIQMVLDSSGCIWISHGSFSFYRNDTTSYYGLTKYNIEKNEWTYLLESDFPYVENLCFAGPLAVDSKSNLWIFMKYIGLAKFDGENIEVFPKDIGNSIVNQMYVDKQDNVVFCYDSLFQYSVMETHDGEKYISTININHIDKTAQINCIDSDLEGNIWFSADRFLSYENSIYYGLYYGLYRYDGSSFEHWNLLDYGIDTNDIDEIYCDSKGKVWLYANGLYSFDGVEFSEYDLSIFEISRDDISNIFEDSDGNIWFCLGGHFIKFDGDELSQIIIKNKQLPFLYHDDMAFDTEGNAYFIHDFRFYKLNGDKFQFYPCKENLKEIVVDSYGTPWMLNKSENTALTFDGNDFKYIPLPVERDTSWGNYWNGGSLRKYGTIKSDKNGHVWAAVNYSSSSRSYFVNQYYTGSMTYGAGLFKMNNSSIDEHYLTTLPDVKNLGKNYPASIEEFDFCTDGTIWLNCRYEHHSTSPYVINKSIWFGLTKFNGTEYYNYDSTDYNIPTNKIGIMKVAPDKDVWFTFREYLNNSYYQLGLMTLKSDGTFYRYDQLSTELPTNTIEELGFDKVGNPYVLIKSPFTDKYKVGKVNKHNKSVSFGPDNGITDEINCFKVDGRGNSWIGSDDGLFVVSPYFEVIHLNTNNSELPGNKVIGLEIDREDNIWINANLGMAIINSKDIVAVEEIFDEGINNTLSLHPNPFSQSTIINYELREAGYISLELFDMLGNKIATLVDDWQEAGTHSCRFNGEGLTAGVYLVRMTSGDGVVTEKVVFIR